MKLKTVGCLIICCVMMSRDVTSQQSTESSGTLYDRHPAVAGTFYPGKADELRREVDGLFETAVPPVKAGNVLALVVPHAGYVFSGQVAASAFKQLNPAREYKRIFLIGSSHTTHFEGASIYARGSFITPLGRVPVDSALAAELLESHEVFRDDKSVHLEEHSLEVQLPFLQQRLQHPFSIVPIVIGGSSTENCRAIAAALKPYLNADNLFVISTDFSHYPSDEDAMEVDGATATAIQQNSAGSLLQVLDANAKKRIPGLVTSLCGWTSVLSLLYMTQDDPAYTYHHLQYMNSADSPYGDTTRVVGYHALAVFGDGHAAETFTVNAEEQQYLLGLARISLEEHLRNGRFFEPDTTQLTPVMKTVCGAFVSLHQAGALRGCIGTFKAREPLYKVIQQMTLAAATEDYRFSRVTAEELDGIDIEISVLSPLKKLSDIREIQLGTHGIYIVKGSQTGTFLPQVALETGWDLETFLGHCARDKAGIGWDGWKTADIYIYTAVVFSEE